MAYVRGEKGNYIQELMDKSNSEWDNNDFEKSVSLLEQAWKVLPEPKEIYDESFLIIWGILEISIHINDLERMKKWVDFIFVTDPDRIDTGERDLWAGKVAYETGDFTKAKSYFKIAHKKSGGRCFGPEDEKYLNFLRGYEIIGENMELKDETYEKVVGLSEEGDILFEAQDFVSAIQKYKKALELLPEPKYLWEASTWVFTAIGDVYFYLEDFSQAKKYFYDAFNCPGGVGNPFILLRLGQSLYETHDVEKAKEYLLKAYMLEAQDIFEAEDPKYLKLIQEFL